MVGSTFVGAAVELHIPQNARLPATTDGSDSTNRSTNINPEPSFIAPLPHVYCATVTLPPPIAPALAADGYPILRILVAKVVGATDLVVAVPDADIEGNPNTPGAVVEFPDGHYRAILLRAIFGWRVVIIPFLSVVPTNNLFAIFLAYKFIESVTGIFVGDILCCKFRFPSLINTLSAPPNSPELLYCIEFVTPCGVC